MFNNIYPEVLKAILDIMMSVHHIHVHVLYMYMYMYMYMQCTT